MPPLTKFQPLNNSFLNSFNQTMGTKAKTPVVAPVSNKLAPKDASTTGNAFLDSYNKSKVTAPVAAPAGNQNVPNQKAVKDMTVSEAAAAGKTDEYNKLVSGYSAPAAPVAPVVPVTAPKPPVAPVTAPTAPTTPTPTQTQNQGYITRLADQSATRNLELANQAQRIASSAGQTISDIGQQGARGAAGYRSTGTSPVGEGNAAILNQSTAAQQQAVAQGAGMELQGVQQGLTAQNQAQTALGQATGYTQPVAGATFFGSPQTGGLVGGAASGGQTGVTGNQLIDGSVQRAYEMIQSGRTTYNDAIATLVGGDVAKQALLARLSSGGTFSPTATNAAVTTNLAMGGDYATQATELSKNLDTFKAQGPKVINFLESTGINRNTGVWSNGIIRDLMKNLNPAYSEIARNYFNELQVSTAQILGRTGQITPTQVTEMSNSDTLSAMTPAELESYISYIDALGQTNLAEIQKKAQEAGGGQFYQGSTANPNAPTSLAPSGSLSQAGIQTTIGLVPSMIGAITGFFGNIFK